MHRFKHGLWQRAFTGGICVALFGAGQLIRAQDAAPVAAATKASAEQLQQWLAELDSDSFDVREAAAEKLAQAGPAAVDVLASGIVSESAEMAWRSGASLERIALTGDEKTLARITSVLDNLSAKGKPGLRSMAAEMHVRQKHFRHDRAVASLKKNGAVFAGDGMELGGGPVFIGGPVAMAVPLIIEEEIIEVVPDSEPAPAKGGDGIFGLIGRLFEAVKGPEEPAPMFGGFGGGGFPGGRGFGGFPPPAAVPAEAIPPRLFLPVDELKAEPVKEERIAEPALEEKPVPEEKPADAKPAEVRPGEPAQVLEEFKELAEPIKVAAPAEVQILAPPPVLAEPVEVALAVFGGDFIGGVIGFDEGDAQVATSLVLGKQWRGGDDGLKVLKDVPEIWMITLNGAKVTDASLPYMAELPNLNSLMVSDTPVTRQGLKKLREQKPDLQIQARGEAMMGVNADIGTSPLVLTSIFPDSGAYQAGLRQGDVIKSVDGSPIKDFADLTISIYGRKAGEKVRLEYERNGAKKSAEVTLKKRADEP